MNRSVHLITAGTYTAPAEIAGIAGTVTLDYDPADPLAVTVIFGGKSTGVAWTVSRDLLQAAFLDVAGEGDVVAWTGADGEYLIHVRYAGQSVTVALPHAKVRSFLDRTFHSVPQGTEYFGIDLDSVLAALLGGK